MSIDSKSFVVQSDSKIGAIKVERTLKPYPLRRDRGPMADLQQTSLGIWWFGELIALGLGKVGVQFEDIRWLLRRGILMSYNFLVLFVFTCGIY